MICKLIISINKVFPLPFCLYINITYNILHCMAFKTVKNNVQIKNIHTFAAIRVMVANVRCFEKKKMSTV